MESLLNRLLFTRKQRSLIVQREGRVKGGERGGKKKRRRAALKVSAEGAHAHLVEWYVRALDKKSACMRILPPYVACRQGHPL